MHDMSVNQLEAIQGIDATANAGANTSASAILQAEKTVLVGHEFMFDNLAFAKKQIGRLLISIFQKYYSGRRIYRIIANQAMRSPVQVGEQKFDEYTQEEIESLLENADLSRYDVEVGESTWSPTQRIATLTILTDLMAKGAQVPMEMMTQFLEMPEELKQRMIESIQQQAQAEQESQSNTAQTEIQKTLIAQGRIPPKVLEEQGLPPEGPPQPAPQAPPQEPIEQQMPQGGYANGPTGLI